MSIWLEVIFFVMILLTIISQSIIAVFWLKLLFTSSKDLPNRTWRFLVLLALPILLISQVETPVKFSNFIEDLSFIPYLLIKILDSFNTIIPIILLFTYLFFDFGATKILSHISLFFNFGLIKKKTVLAVTRLWFWHWIVIFLCKLIIIIIFSTIHHESKIITKFFNSHYSSYKKYETSKKNLNDMLTYSSEKLGFKIETENINSRLRFKACTKTLDGIE